MCKWSLAIPFLSQQVETCGMLVHHPPPRSNWAQLEDKVHYETDMIYVSVCIVTGGSQQWGLWLHVNVASWRKMEISYRIHWLWWNLIVAEKLPVINGKRLNAELFENNDKITVLTPVSSQQALRFCPRHSLAKFIIPILGWKIIWGVLNFLVEIERKPHKNRAHEWKINI